MSKQILLSLQSDNVLAFVDDVIQYLTENFVNGKIKFAVCCLKFNFHIGCLFLLACLNYLEHDVLFVAGKISKAKSLVMDAVCLAQNRGLIQHMGSSSYGMDTD